MSANPRVIGIAGGDLSGSFVDPVVVSVAHVTGGVLGIANGGTGLSSTPTNGQLLIGSGSSYSLATLNPGANINVVNGTGTIDIALYEDISVTSVTASQALVSGGLTVGNYIQMLPVGNVTIPTNLTASYIYTSGSTNDLYFTQYQGALTNTTRLRWLEGTLYTGLLHGGVLSTVTGTTSFNITSGSGLIVSYNASTGSEPYPTVKLVQWGAYVSQSLQYSSSAEITYVSIDSNGEISQATSPPTFAQYKDRIFLGRVLHQSGSVTNGSINTPPTAYGNTSNLADFARAIGPLKINGHFLAASGSTLSFTKTAGDSYVEGRNYTVNPNIPNIVLAADDPEVTVSKIYREYLSGSSVIIDNGVGGAGYTTLDPAQYQNGNTLSAVENNKFSVQRIYWFPRAVNRALFAYYGQAKYDNFDDAVAGISTENFTEGANTAGSAILVAYVILNGGATNFSDPASTRIVQAGLFRGAGTGGGSGVTGGGATNLNGLSDVIIGTPVTGEALVYNGTEWVDGTPLNATSASFATNATSASFATTSLTSSYLNTLSQDLILSGNLTVTSIVSGTINGNGSGLVNLTASGIQNFTNDVRSQFTAGTNITITNGQISAAGGSSGSGSNTTASFSNSSTWTFNHNLSNRTPVIQVLDSNYNQIIPQNIEFTNTSSAIITFPTSESGYAIASLGGNATSASYATTSSFATTSSYSLTSALTPSIYYVQGILSGDQTIPTSSDTLVSFVDEYDPNNWWNATSKQFTPTVSGTYSVTFAVWLEAPLTGSGQVNIQARKNNNTFMIVQQPLHNNAGSGIGLIGTKLVQLNGTSDYVDFTVYNGAASSKKIQASNGTWFSAHLLTM